MIALDPSSSPELLSRSQCWQLVHLELSLLDGKCRPVESAHSIISEVIWLITNNDFPLTIPPRWLVELFYALERVATLRMEANCWSFCPSAPLDAESQSFFDAVMQNIENDKRRSRRQHVSFSAGDTEALVDSSGQSLLPPDEDSLVPPLPHGFPWDHRPRLWSEVPRVETPKRERAEDDSSSESDGMSREPTRRASVKGGFVPHVAARSCPPVAPLLRRSSPIEAAGGTAPESQALVPFQAPSIASPYGTAPQTQPRVIHFVIHFVTILHNPLRHYPSSVFLYGVVPDGALLVHPVFGVKFGAGKDQKSFTRGENDPAMCVLNAIGAKRVRGESLDFSTWNDNSTQPEISHPFSDQNDLFHVFELPQRRAVNGPDMHRSLGSVWGKRPPELGRIWFRTKNSHASLPFYVRLIGES